jgi:membrane associated rhomboid family serine protease
VAVCYRHSGRETNVACSACGRPICTDCMTVTPVGMRCPDCAGRSARSARVRRPRALSRAAAPATYALLAINVVAFIAEIGGGGGAGSFEGGGRLIHDAGLNGPQVADGEWWRIVTAAFLHAGPLHLLLNMFALFILGSLLEPGIGTARFLGVYAVSLLAGSFGALLLDPYEITVGASGAIFGLMSAAFVVARRRGLEDLAGQIGIYVLLNLAFTFGVPGISVGGHLGGLVGGALAALVIIVFERRPRAPGLEAIALTALGAVAVAGALVAASAS